MLYIRRSRLTRYFVVPLMLLALLSGCYKWSLPGQGPADYIRAEGPSKVRVTLKDSRRFVVEDPTVGDGAITGTVGDSTVTIPLDRLWSLEERHLDHPKTWGLAAGALVVGTVLSTLMFKAVAEEMFKDWDDFFRVKHWDD